jgi:hypothetical protein
MNAAASAVLAAASAVLAVAWGMLAVASGMLATDPTRWTARYPGQKYVASILSNAAPDARYLQMTRAEAGGGRLSQ